MVPLGGGEAHGEEIWFLTFYGEDGSEFATKFNGGIYVLADRWFGKSKGGLYMRQMGRRLRHRR